MRLVLFCFSAFLLVAQAQTGGVRGSVMDAVSHLPVRKALISLQPLSPAPSGKSLAQHSISTDAGGTFALDQLEPGPYRLTVFHQSYPQTPFSTLPGWKSLSVTAGGTTGPLNIQLTPGAAVSGHLLDEDGDPLSGCVVQLHPAKHPEQGVPAVGYAGLPSRAADPGEYRLFNIFPGKYVLTARCQAPVFRARPLSAGPDPAPSLAYLVRFYPAADTAAAAEVIELSAGMERTGTDFHMRPVPVTHINVTLDGGSWRGRKDLVWRLASLGQASSGALQGWRTIDTSRDSFEIPQVLPGSYLLLVSSNVAGINQPTGPLLAGVQRVEVKDRPVETSLLLHAPISIAGTVSIEDSPADAPKKLLLSQIEVHLTSDTSAASQNTLQPVSVHDDGTFIIKSMFPLPAHVVVTAPAAFMKSAWFGNSEMTGGAIDLSTGAAGPLKIVVSTNTASLHGVAAPGVQILASPPDSRFGRGRITHADQNGQFKLDGLPPGTYRVAPAGQEEGGEVITLQEGETGTVDIKSAPAP